MAKIFAKPGIDKQTGEQFVLRNPATLARIPADGAFVELDMVTRRRLRDGDLVEATQPSAAKVEPERQDESAPAHTAKAAHQAKNKG